MQDTLVVYDDNGVIFTQITGSFTTPVGLQYLITKIPQGNYIKGVDVSAIPHEVMFADIPKTETQELQDALSKASALIAMHQIKLEETDASISELSMIVGGSV